MPTLNNLVGTEILLRIPRLQQTKEYFRVKLVGVEYGGLWIKSQEMVNAALQAIDSATAPRTPVFFFPYQEIAVAIATADGPALNEKAFGV